MAAGARSVQRPPATMPKLQRSQRRLIGADKIDYHARHGRGRPHPGDGNQRSAHGWKLQPVGGSCQRFEGPLIQSEPGRSVMLCRAALAG